MQDPENRYQTVARSDAVTRSDGKILLHELDDTMYHNSE
jgi:hypothetical protein